MIWEVESIDVDIQAVDVEGCGDLPSQALDVAGESGGFLVVNLKLLFGAITTGSAGWSE